MDLPIPHNKLKTRVMIVDDHLIFVAGIKALLSFHDWIEVVGMAHNGEEAISKAKGLAPDIILMDIKMPIMNGLEATAILRKECPGSKVILLSMYDDIEFVSQFVDSGGQGYILKSNTAAELFQAIKLVKNGGAFFSPQISKTLLEVKRLSKLGSTEELTHKEQEVLTLIGKGHSSKQIAYELSISLRTVGKHRERIAHKLNIHTVSEFTKYAISKKFVNLNET